MIKLIIDIGNSLIKIGLFTDDKLSELISVRKNYSEEIKGLIGRFGIPHSCIVSSVRSDPESVIQELVSVGIGKIISVRSGLRLPVKVLYKTPETLGNDRLANVCGAAKMYPAESILIVDMGTCIKYDFLSDDGSYLGGSISPGLKMRYKALSSFTGQLPYFKPNGQFPALIGQSTEGSIRSGVEMGIVAEIDGIINMYQSLHVEFRILLTGGDAMRFADKLKSPIFVAPNLTLNGLKVILDHNDH